MAGKISRTQGEELLHYLEEVNYSKVFELLDSYELNDYSTINVLKQEFVLGFANATFNHRLKIYVQSLVNQAEKERIAIENNKPTQNTTNKQRNYLVISAIVFVFLLSGGYVFYKWDRKQTTEKNRLAEIEKAKQDSIRVQDSLFKVNITWQALEAFQVNEKWGFRDKQTQQVTITPQYDKASAFSEGFALVKKGKLWGFVDKTGKEVITPKYADAWSFSNDLARIKKGKLWGFIDKIGKEVITPQYDDTGSFSEELAWVKNEGKYSFIDKLGKVVITLQYNEAASFHEGLAGVKQGEKWGFINTKGEELILCIYDNAWQFLEGLAMVKKNGKIFYINKKGECVKGDCP
jgi:hypothetical protein